MNNWIKQKIANIEFWWAKQSLKEGTDFKYVDWESDVFDPYETAAIKILTGRFAGITFKFSNIKIVSTADSLLEFQTVILDLGQIHSSEVFTKAFEKVTANILRIILANTTSCSAKDVEQGLINEDRTHNTDEPNEKREFHEEVSPLLEKRISKRKSRKGSVSRNTRLHSKVQPVAEPKRPRTKSTRKDKSIRE